MDVFPVWMFTVTGCGLALACSKAENTASVRNAATTAIPRMGANAVTSAMMTTEVAATIVMASAAMRPGTMITSPIVPPGTVMTSAVVPTAMVASETTVPASKNTSRRENQGCEEEREGFVHMKVLEVMIDYRMRDSEPT